jgi:hypothetical protein
VTVVTTDDRGGAVTGSATDDGRRGVFKCAFRRRLPNVLVDRLRTVPTPCALGRAATSGSDVVALASPRERASWCGP